ncbi:MAG: hypothetical protein M1826_000622 [Phylliscum demangeonii]|nr:MAG: hypothetical protein M1826_000622 [Phylliscum demangeonii]
MRKGVQKLLGMGTTRQEEENEVEEKILAVAFSVIRHVKQMRFMDNPSETDPTDILFHIKRAQANGKFEQLGHMEDLYYVTSARIRQVIDDLEQLLQNGALEEKDVVHSWGLKTPGCKAVTVKEVHDYLKLQYRDVLLSKKVRGVLGAAIHAKKLNDVVAAGAMPYRLVDISRLEDHREEPVGKILQDLAEKYQAILAEEEQARILLLQPEAETTEEFGSELGEPGPSIVLGCLEEEGDSPRVSIGKSDGANRISQGCEEDDLEKGILWGFRDDLLPKKRSGYQESFGCASLTPESSTLGLQLQQRERGFTWPGSERAHSVSGRWSGKRFVAAGPGARLDGPSIAWPHDTPTSGNGKLFPPFH